ncbi:putative mediator of RNA polymerase II transcription subunit 26 [Bicyclus anynana]|uniref:Mediator of RNA polymerase II transcription subunit 26 n=1 Tax=Bicyclus anynana TaxID=110368 RepID=A0A6J1NZA0_BICAN|nr:putative mediator of RNA polymerase II transcription subunit 26 [Bicyclus anynana]
MLKFLGFKASLNFNNGKSSGLEYFETPGISLNGAYRTNKDELFGSDLYTEHNTPKKSTPSQRKVPTKSLASNKQSKSTSELTKPSNEAMNVRKSVPDISQTASQPPQINIKEQKKLEKQRLAEQKKQEKLAEKERQRAEKLRKATEKQKVVQPSAAQSQPQNQEQKKPKKRAAPQPQKQSTAPQVQQQRTQQSTQPSNRQSKQQLPRTPSDARHKQQYTTNTLESSISKSSGPPPYSSVSEISPNTHDGTGNTSFSTPVEDMDSWGLISQHRQQMNRQAGVSKSSSKQKHLDLNYNAGSTRTKETSKS